MIDGQICRKFLNKILAIILFSLALTVIVTAKTDSSDTNGRASKLGDDYDQLKGIDSLINLVKTLEVVNTKINSLKDVHKPKLTVFQSSVTSINTQIEQLAIYTQGLGKSIGFLSGQLQSRKSTIDQYVVENIGTAVTKDSGKPGLVIEAMIPDRVWLTTIRGTKLSIKLGDNIPGYGKITLIDVASGLVKTDRGLKLRQFND